MFYKQKLNNADISYHNLLFDYFSNEHYTMCFKMFLYFAHYLTITYECILKVSWQFKLVQGISQSSIAYRQSILSILCKRLVIKMPKHSKNCSTKKLLYNFPLRQDSCQDEVRRVGIFSSSRMTSASDTPLIDDCLTRTRTRTQWTPQWTQWRGIQISVRLLKYERMTTTTKATRR